MTHATNSCATRGALGRLFIPLVLTCASVACGGPASDDPAAASATTAEELRARAKPAFLDDARVVYADGLHNENTELLRLRDGRLLLAFRGGETAQTRSPRARIKISESRDEGRTFTPLAEIGMPNDPADPTDDRDIRDPKLVVFDGRLFLYAISRRPSPGVRDLGGEAWTVRSESRDGGRTWSTPTKTFTDRADDGTETHWGFWRFTARAAHGKRDKATLYATGYDDGDTKVGLFSSTDGVTFRKRGLILDSYDDIPSEAELKFLGRDEETAVALVRLDNQSYLDNGQTAICTKSFPFDGPFECGRRIEQRLDGPTWIDVADKKITRHFVFARKSLACTRKRTAAYELRGDLATAGAPITVCEAGELPSAGDTAYTALAPLSGGGRDRYLLSWYSSHLDADVPWLEGQFAPSDIWLADVDFGAYDARACATPGPDPVCPPPPLPAGTRVDATGSYLLTLAPVVWPSLGVFFDAEVVLDGAAITLRLQPLDQNAMFGGGQRVPVGAPITAVGAIGLDGRFQIDFGLVRLPVAAFPLLGADPPLVLVLGGQTVPAGICGDAFGRVVFGVGANDYIDIGGSTFGSARGAPGQPVAPVGRCP